MNKFVDGDLFGTHPNVKIPMSTEDKRVLKTIEDSIRHDRACYEIGLTWFEKPDLTDNYHTVLNQFHALERRFERDREYADKYSSVMDQYTKLRFAKVVSDQEIASTPIGRANYLPNHVAINPNKQSQTSVQCFLQVP